MDEDKMDKDEMDRMEQDDGPRKLIKSIHMQTVEL